MRAPRKTKLNKPRPLKTSRSDENGNVNSELRSNKDTSNYSTSTCIYSNTSTEEFFQCLLSIKSSFFIHQHSETTQWFFLTSKISINTVFTYFLLKYFEEN